MAPRVDADANVDAVDDVDVACNARAPNPAWTKAPWASISTSNRPRSTRGFERRPPRASDADGQDEDAGAESMNDSASAMASEDVEARHWRECFRRARDVDVGTRGTFRVYANDASSSPSTTSRTPEGAPVCFLLHGCPYTALTWGGVAEEFARRVRDASRVFATRGRRSQTARRRRRSQHGRCGRDASGDALGDERRVDVDDDARGIGVDRHRRGERVARASGDGRDGGRATDCVFVSSRRRAMERDARGGDDESSIRRAVAAVAVASRGRGGWTTTIRVAHGRARDGAVLAGVVRRFIEKISRRSRGETVDSRRKR